MTRFYIENAEEFDRACRLLDKRDVPYDIDGVSLRGITGDDQIAQWDTRFDAKGKKVLDDAE